MGRQGTIRGAIANQQMMLEVEKRFGDIQDRIEGLEIENDDLLAVSLFIVATECEGRPS